MFAKTIVTSDDFLDMPLSARCLYFALGMFADDDGFVNNPKSIMRQVGACQDDMNILLMKSYILAFESGVIVIRHWRIHNYIQKDRYKETLHLAEKSQLQVGKKGEYTECIHDVYITDTQVREGKDRIVKDSIEIGEVRVEEAKAECATLPQQILDLYNTICSKLPRADMLSDNRKQKIEEGLKRYSLDDFKRCFEIASRSAFLKGNNKRKWCASFDWLIDSVNMSKVLAGNYTDNNRATSFDVDEFYEAAVTKSYKDMPKTAADDEAIRERAERLKEQLG